MLTGSYSAPNSIAIGSVGHKGFLTIVTMQQPIMSKQQLHETLASMGGKVKSVGLVPTMGALHAGHVSLVKRAAAENDVVVVSDFVNPTQFNDPSDYKTYPRTLEADAGKLSSFHNVLLFAPSAEEMYPKGETEQHFDVAPLDTVMEGARRPGHFAGVMQIVSRLFSLVRPNRAYFGEKDYQQLLIVRRMAEQQGLGIEVIGCPIVREADGLATSSRNTLLTPEGRAAAPKIHHFLEASREFIKAHDVTSTVQWVTEQINAVQGLQVEYFAITDAQTLQAVEHYTMGATMGFIAVRVGAVRLIDNVKY